MASQSPDASRNAVNATRAVVTLIAEPRTAPVSARPSFLNTATTPKQAADSSGRVICHGRIPPPADRKQDRPEHDDHRACQDRRGDALSEQQDRHASGEERVQVDESRGDRGTDLLDADEPQEPTGHGADEDEEGDPGRRQATEPARQEHSGPEADGPDDEVDPEPRIGAATAEALPDEDRGARRAEGAGEREHVDGARHRSSQRQDTTIMAE